MYLFRYFGKNELYLNGLVIPDLAAENYLISIIDWYGCSFEEIITLNAPPPFFIDLGPDLEVELGESILIEPINNCHF